MGILNGGELVQEALENADILSALQPDEILRDILRACDEHYVLFLITGSPETAANKKLVALGIDNALFRIRLYAGAEVQRHDGSAFEPVARELGTSLDRLLFVGDREKVDILPAKACGVSTAIVNATSKHATYQLRSIYDIANVLLED